MRRVGRILSIKRKQQMSELGSPLRVRGKILGIIPARAGSKRVPLKNFRPFAGTTLMDLAIQQALDATCLDEVLVSSDADEVLEIAARYENIIPLKRPDALASDTAPAIDYQTHALAFMETEFGKTFDWVVVIQPSSPLRSGKDIDATVQLFKKHPEADSAVSVVAVEHMVHPYKLKTMQGDRLLPFIEDEGKRTAAQDLPTVYTRNCAVYVFKTALIKQGIQLGENSVGHVMPRETSVDVNDMLDFEFAEYLYLKHFKNKI
jgi:CMP-N,N'-diacetyllegionaminic acid synthase